MKEEIVDDISSSNYVVEDFDDMSLFVEKEML